MECISSTKIAPVVYPPVALPFNKPKDVQVDPAKIDIHAYGTEETAILAAVAGGIAVFTTKKVTLAITIAASLLGYKFTKDTPSEPHGTLQAKTDSLKNAITYQYQLNNNQYNGDFKDIHWITNLSKPTIDILYRNLDNTVMLTEILGFDCVSIEGRFYREKRDYYTRSAKYGIHGLEGIEYDHNKVESTEINDIYNFGLDSLKIEELIRRLNLK